MLNRINNILSKAVQNNVSDIHFKVENLPFMRLDGDILTISGEEKWNNKDMQQLMQEMLNAENIKKFTTNLVLDFSYNIPNVARFRGNFYQDTAGIALALRPIPEHIPSFEDLNMEDVFKSLCYKEHGLILFTGPTGCGKSTSLATMIDHINETQRKHIITIEQPIEFYHKNKSCLVNQMEVGLHSKSFNASLVAMLREDPDIILVGELRDLETIRLALTAAETGHVVYATLHTSSAVKTINRIIDIFPGAEKEVVRTILADSLQTVIAQRLLKKNDQNGGRVAAREIMICTPAIRSMIRSNKIPQIYSAIQTGQRYGMITMEQSLEKLINDDIISGDVSALLQYTGDSQII